MRTRAADPRGRPDRRSLGEGAIHRRTGVALRRFLVGFAALLSAGCMETRYSLKDMPLPVTLTRNAALGGQQIQSRPVARYLGETSEELICGTIITHRKTNSSQIHASAALGGQENRAIVDLSLDIWDYMFAFGIYQVGIRAQGDVVEVGRREIEVRP